MDWKGIADQAMKDIAEMRAELNEQDKEIERLREALKFYANHDNYFPIVAPEYKSSKVELDQGEIAYKALGEEKTQAIKTKPIETRLKNKFKELKGILQKESKMGVLPYKEWREVMASEDGEFMKLSNEKRWQMYLEYWSGDGMGEIKVERQLLKDLDDEIFKLEKENKMLRKSLEEIQYLHPIASETSKIVRKALKRI